MEKLSILMNSYNRPDIIDEAIQSLLKSELPKELELEIVIVDDHSKEETWNIIEKYQNDKRFIIYRNEKNIGSGALNWNKGYKLSTGDLIIINADDVVFEKKCIKRLYNELKKHDRFTIVLGVWINVDKMGNYPTPKIQINNYGLKISYLTGMPYRDTHGKDIHVINPPSLCYKDVLNGLDELYHYFPVNGMREETDLFLRIMKQSPKRKIVVVDSALRYHVHNTSGGYRMKSRTYKKWTRKNHRLFIRRNFGFRSLYMIPFFHLYLTQKWIRDLIGKNIIERSKK